MINKQSIWFTFLFSVILVLSIFYITMGDEKLEEFINVVDTNDTTLVVNESTELVALRVQSDEEMMNTINELQEIILSDTSEVQDKNDAYDKLMNLSNNKSNEEKIEKILFDEFKIESFVKINGNNVTVVADSSKHDFSLANSIIRRISTEFSSDKYVTVKFN
jgi:hypothetical protein